MINYSSFSIDQLLAVDEVLDYITDMLDSDLEAAIVYREYRLAHQAVAAAIDQQVRDAAEPAGDPPEEDPAALRDLQSLVDDLSRCSSRLAALSEAEDEHFAESARTDVLNKVILLRNCNRAVIRILFDIHDHYDGLH